MVDMYYVYVLKSLNNSWYYVGLSQDPIKRLSEHNSGKTRSTKSRRPYRLIYTKKFENRKDARDYEKYLKIRSNKEALLKELNEIS